MAKKKDAGEAIKDALVGISRSEGKRGALTISSGSTLADIVVGGGRVLGFETGEVVLIESQSGAGKTAWGNEIVANAYHTYKKQYPGKFKHRYIDKESGSTIDSLKQYGYEIVPLDFNKRIRPETLQDNFANTMQFLNSLKPDEYGVHVTDSITSFFDETAKARAEARVDAYERDKPYEEATMGMEMAKYLSTEYFKGICPATEEKNALVVLIAQYRSKKLPSGGTYLDLQNGEALKYYANTRVKLTVADEIVVKGKSIGAVVKVEGKKVRGPWPYRHAFVTIYFSMGIDNLTSNVEYLYDLRTDTGKLAKDGNKIPLIWDMPSDEVLKDLSKEEQKALLATLGMNKFDLISYIEENNLEDELAQRVIAKWNQEEADAVKTLVGRKKRFQD